MRLFIAFGAALLLAACAAGPEQVAKEFTRAGAEGQTAAAMELLDPQVKQSMGAKLPMAMGQVARQTTARGGVQKIETTTISADGDYAQVMVTTTYNNGSSQNETAKLRKVDGKWFITM